MKRRRQQRRTEIRRRGGTERKSGMHAQGRMGTFRSMRRSKNREESNREKEDPWRFNLEKETRGASTSNLEKEDTRSTQRAPGDDAASTSTDQTTRMEVVTPPNPVKNRYAAAETKRGKSSHPCTGGDNEGDDTQPAERSHSWHSGQQQNEPPDPHQRPKAGIWKKSNKTNREIPSSRPKHRPKRRAGGTEES